MIRLTVVLLNLGPILLAGCSGDKSFDMAQAECPLYTPPGKPVGVSHQCDPPYQTPITPEIAVENLRASIHRRDMHLYSDLIHTDFYFTEADCQGNITYSNDREEEIDIMGPTGRSAPGLLATYRTIEWTFSPSEPIPEDAESQIKINGLADVLLLSAPEVGHKVNQEMTFFLQKDDRGFWTIARWEAKTQCTSEPEDNSSIRRSSWGEIKASFLTTN